MKNNITSEGADQISHYLRVIYICKTLIRIEKKINRLLKAKGYKNKKKVFIIILFLVVFSLIIFSENTKGIPNYSSYTYGGECNQIQCHYYYYIDNNSNACNLRKFCGMYMYYGLKVYTTKQECLQQRMICVV